MINLLLRLSLARLLSSIPECERHLPAQREHVARCHCFLMGILRCGDLKVKMLRCLSSKLNVPFCDWSEAAPRLDVESSF